MRHTNDHKPPFPRLFGKENIYIHFVAQSTYLGNHDDGDRAILPTLMYNRTVLEEDHDYVGYALMLGWWKWGVGVHILTVKKERH